MPSKSKKQQNFMAAVANNPKFAKKAGVPQSVGKDYEEADKMKGMKKYQRGGPMPARPMPAGMANPQAGVANAPPPPMGEMKKEYTRFGGESAAEARARGEAEDARRAPRTKETAMRGAAARRSGGSTPRGMKKGGSVRGSGCATKGTRPAKMVTMKGS